MGRAATKWKNSLPWILFVSGLLSVATAIYTYAYEPNQYQAMYTFFALPSGNHADKLPLEASRMLARDSQALLRTDGFRSAVHARQPSDGQCSVAVRLLGDAHIMGVEVTGVEPAMVQGLANAIGTELVARMKSELSAREARAFSSAALPDEASGPKRLLKTLLTLVGAFVAGSVIGCIFGSPRQMLRASRMAIPALRAPCLSVVADYRADLKCFLKIKRKKQKKGSRTGMLSGYVERLVKENVRTAALSLRVAAGVEAVRSTVITSMNPREGKSSFALLLSAELAQQGFRVLLVEMDGYSAFLEPMIGVEGRADLFDYLSERAQISDVILPTPIKNLSFIPLYHAASAIARMAAASGFERFLHSVGGYFDFVFLNAPPAGLYTDAAMLGAVADGILLTVADNRYTAAEVSAVVRELAAAGRRVLGFVFTQVPARRARILSNFDEDALAKGCIQA